MRLETIELEKIIFDKRNPRTAPNEDLDGLVASIKTSGKVIQPPILMPHEDGKYIVLVGERRIRAAMRSGLSSVDCLVITDGVSPLEAHNIRVIENLHRKELSPIDHAISLRICWLAENAKRLGCDDDVAMALSEENTLPRTLEKIESILENNGFKKNAPAVTWNEVLDMLGIDIHPESRKKLLRILAVPIDVQEKLRKTNVSEASIRSIGTLDEEMQRELVDEILNNEDVGKNVRRVVNAVSRQGYTLKEAIDEVSAVRYESNVNEGETSVNSPEEEELQELIILLVDNMTNIISLYKKVQKIMKGGTIIPAPWDRIYKMTVEKLMNTFAK